jgi:GT2 family glycosyltransferase/glycosyltransferase involved in cell wall biosynthesis
VKAVDIVIPVYDGLEETKSCIESVLATVTGSNVRVVLVNDCSPNPAISQLLRDIADQYAVVELLENEANLGFVATANRGMQYADGRDVLLLNSDVEVAGDWLQQLHDAAWAQDKVGSVTPFSNNATICSFPNFCKDNELLFGSDVQQLHSYFSRTFSSQDMFQVPTGVGFCMYIRRDCLQQVGYFDVDTFGRGYGEENDWCQRAQAAGWPNYHLASCFVYHKGGVSFAEEHSPRIAKAQEILDKKYPAYHADVQRYIADDPAKGCRTDALIQLFAAQQRPKIAFVSHKLGGGAQQHVDELARLYAGDALFVQITPDTDGVSVTLSFFECGTRLQDGLYLEVDREYDKLTGLLKQLGVGRLHFHHTMGLHPRLWRLSDALGCEYDLTIHDYFLINGNPTLTDGDACFVTDGRADFDEACARHYPLPEGVSAQQWRENQRLLVEGASRVIFPSQDCRQRFERYFQISHPVVAWHPDYQQSQPYPQPVWSGDQARPLRVLVLGAISREKGADVLEQVAASLGGKDIEFHLLGYAYRALEGGVVTHGPYSNERVYELVQAIAPDVVWYPALWPETYSYTLSVALHQGLPVVVPDIGAFVERVTGRGLSVIRPWDTSIEQWADFFAQLHENGERAMVSNASAGASAVPGDVGDFYCGAYLAPVAAIAGEVDAVLINDLRGNLHAGLPELTRRERILGRIWSLSRSPLVAKAISLVPFSLQRALKRRLSSRPMHDIVRGE